jgi:2-oxoisovalerate dehydrogenase E2 component (dihydrolipoyl transacylase)
VREHSLLLGDIAGSGKDGRVTKEDVLRHVETGGTASPAAPAAAAAHAPAATVSETRTLLRGYGRAMVKAMTTSWVAPHFGYCEEVSMDALMAVRAATAAGAAERGVKLTYLPFLLKATSLALADFPVLNSRLSADGREVLYRQAHNIGVAMDTPSGLVVPVLQDVQGASVWKLAREMARLQAAAANNKLGEADLSGATFT